jgi:hypothetical protein
MPIRTGTRREGKSWGKQRTGSHDIDPEGACFGGVDPVLPLGFGEGVQDLKGKEIRCEELDFAVAEIVPQ